MQINKRRPNLKTLGGRYSSRETGRVRQIRQLTAPQCKLREETRALMTPLPMFAYVVRPVGGGPYPLLIGWSPAKGKMTMMLQNRAPRIFLGIFLAIFVVPALAHDPSRPELNGWYDKLASGIGLCCSLTDGVTVADPDWESKDGHYRVRLGGEWIDVPDDALVTVPNRAGRTMVWPMPMIEGDTIRIRCFMPGSMT